jgi:hypothetical protein
MLLLSHSMDPQDTYQLTLDQLIRTPRGLPAWVAPWTPVKASAHRSISLCALLLAEHGAPATSPLVLIKEELSSFIDLLLLFHVFRFAASSVSHLTDTPECNFYPGQSTPRKRLSR